MCIYRFRCFQDSRANIVSNAFVVVIIILLDPYFWNVYFNDVKNLDVEGDSFFFGFYLRYLDYI